ncbi:hypothetical protein BGZ63DRAFT_389673 [Mariannaea sp. PMI_226]|nr:hypothetical protein BGZ63DRAFT_389673 [Mariannaea sp. PMI_226]
MTAPIGQNTPEPKRRKIRKGTQSCWECKRRKVRCRFVAGSDDTACANCIRRGTACVSQEHEEQPLALTTTGDSSNNKQIEARLGRVEQLIESIVDTRATTLTLTEGAGRQSRLTESPFSSRDPICHTAPDFTGDEDTTSLNNRDSPIARPETPHSPIHQLYDTFTSLIHSKQTVDKYEQLSCALVAAWPGQKEIDLICKLPVSIPAHIRGSICVPYSSSISAESPSTRNVLQLPPLSSHPVLIARKLLQLGIFLQSAPPESLRDLDISYCHIMTRVVDTATKLVTTNDDLIGSIEGIECIIMEAMYHNYAGYLHRAWMAVRRATAVAQMMALHNGLNSRSVKILEPETRAIFDADQVCFRLVSIDRYLSLMLGLPRTSLESFFASPKALEGCQPIDRMQRIYCIVADRILQREENDLVEMYEIDTLMQRAAAEMPPQWWLMPNILGGTNISKTDPIHETSRLMDHFTHYHLLLRLHLPYLLHAPSDQRYHHSKMTAINAGREALARYVAFRSNNPDHFYCRGVDFIAFIATTVLCLAYIDFRGQNQCLSRSVGSSNFDFLAHSRLGDRGLMERTVDIIECMARAGSDAIASKIARILGHLLAVEANAASGTSYSTNSSCGDGKQELECHGQLTNGGKMLQVHIPCFGTINFERRTISKASFGGQTTEQRLLPDPPDQQGQTHLYRPGPSSMCEGDAQVTVQADPGQAVPVQSDLPGDGLSSFRHGGIPEDSLPNIQAIGELGEDWDLQGVDITLFDTLFRGTTGDPIEEGTWGWWMN